MELEHIPVITDFYMYIAFCGGFFSSKKGKIFEQRVTSTENTIKL